MTETSEKIKNDGIVNVLTNLKVKGRDRTTGLKFVAGAYLDERTLENIYRYQGFGKRIIDLITHEMTRQWFTVSGDHENVIVGRLEEIGAKEKIRDLVRWSRLFGGAIAVVGADDGLELSDPLDENRIRSINFIHVFDRYQVDWNTSDLYMDPLNPKYGQPEFYNVSPVSTGATFRVHESRTLRMDGDCLPARARHLNQGWGDSVLQSCYDELKHLASAYGASANIIEDFIQTILSVENLGDMLAAGQDELINKRLNIIDLSRSVANTILLDSNETYSKQASSISGLDNLIDRFCVALCAVTGIPYTLLMGKSPAGLQATGDADMRIFYDLIKAKQEEKLQPVLERLVHLLISSKDSNIQKLGLENWKIEFSPLWQLSEAEKAVFRKSVADTDRIYIETGVVDPSEIALSRFGGHVYSSETHIDVGARGSASFTGE